MRRYRWSPIISPSHMEPKWRLAFRVNLDRNYSDRNIRILSDRQAEIKVLNNHQIFSKLLWDCHKSLIQLLEHMRVKLI
jgi:hypothetical protein